jgi:hypothetical protein
VREDDVELELLDDDTFALEEGSGSVVAMSVKQSPLVWQTFSDEDVELSEGGTVATQLQDYEGEDACLFLYATTGIALTEGRYYWEVELLSGTSYVGVSRPNLHPVGGVV